jgi:uncharacterized protein YbaP (TraB family)
MEWLILNKKISIDRKYQMDRKMTDKSTQNINEIRGMRNTFFINMIVKRNEVWQHRKNSGRAGENTYRIQKRKPNYNNKHCETG